MKRKPRSDKGKSRKPYKHSQELVQSKSDTIKQETNEVILTGVKSVTESKEFTFEDLPDDIKRGIERTLNYRQSLGLPDDSESRKQKAINYYKWEMEKNDLRNNESK